MQFTMYKLESHIAIAQNNNNNNNNNNNLFSLLFYKCHKFTHFISFMKVSMPFLNQRDGQDESN